MGMYKIVVETDALNIWFRNSEAGNAVGFGLV
jgi:hypothetical protein